LVRDFIIFFVMLALTTSCSGSPAVDSTNDMSDDLDVLPDSTAASSTVVADSPTPTVSVSADVSLGDSIVGPPDADWNWQLSGELDTSVDVAVWDVDLFETPAEVIAELQADGRYVICYLSAGSIEDWRSDVGGIEDSAIGLPLDDWPGEKWLDVRADSVLAMAEDRVALAAEKRCDAVEPDNVDGFSNETGFSLSEADQIGFNALVAQFAHKRGLAVGLKNSFDIGAELVNHFDFAVIEQCHEYDECEPLGLFVEAGKPVFNAEYPGGESGAVELAAEQCDVADGLGIHTVFLPLDLDGSWRVSCG
jgi:hypothetical protein